MALARILVVDDEPQVCAMVGDVLAELGYLVQIAGDGAEAIGLMRQFQPDVVLLDVLMPGMTGDDVMAWLRREHPHVPIVMVTGQLDTDRVRDLLASGAFDYVRKPFEVDVLERIVGAAVAAVGP